MDFKRLLLVLIVNILSSTLVMGKKEKFVLSKALLPQDAARSYCREASRVLARVNRRAIRFIRDKTTPMVWAGRIKISNDRLPKGLVFLFRDKQSRDICCKETLNRRECNREICNCLAPALCSR